MPVHHLQLVAACVRVCLGNDGLSASTMASAAGLAHHKSDGLGQGVYQALVTVPIPS